MHRPDYRGGSIVNLMTSLRQAFGSPGGEYIPLRLLPPEEIAGRHIVLIIADGVGYDRCAALTGSTLQRHLRGPITSVFPTTTATAITSFYTGVAPQQHGMTGWFTWFRELGSVAMVLPFMPRRGGLPYTAQGVDPAQLFLRPSIFFDPLPGRVINPAHVADSPYSRACGGAAERWAYQEMEEMFALLRQSLEGPPRLTLAYWAEYDALCHHQGVHSEQAEALLRRFDREVARLLDHLAGRNGLLLVTADHGMVDTTPGRTIHLDAHPDLQAMLSLPLCGEPRTAFCYVHADRREHFLDYVARHLADCCQVTPSRTLLAEEWFGLGAPHPELHHRIGDYTLRMNDGYVVTERLPGEKPFSQTGVHGGHSRAEMEVPLIVAMP
jgi:hypothetical protein